jgi:hypothetical protein
VRRDGPRGPRDVLDDLSGAQSAARIAHFLADLRGTATEALVVSEAL